MFASLSARAGGEEGGESEGEKCRMLALKLLGLVTGENDLDNIQILNVQEGATGS